MLRVNKCISWQNKYRNCYKDYTFSKTESSSYTWTKYANFFGRNIININRLATASLLNNVIGAQKKKRITAVMQHKVSLDFT